MAPMSESRMEPASPLTAPSKINGIWEDEEDEDELPSWEPGGGSRNIQPKSTKPGKQPKRKSDRTIDEWEMGTTTTEVVGTAVRQRR